LPVLSSDCFGKGGGIAPSEPKNINRAVGLAVSPLEYFLPGQFLTVGVFLIQTIRYIP
jgi:hypothetical protein